MSPQKKLKTSNKDKVLLLDEENKKFSIVPTVAAPVEKTAKDQTKSPQYQNSGR